MLNVLLSTYDFNNEYCYPKIKKYLKPNMEVVILPFAHHESYYENEKLFDSLYNYKFGKDYNIICNAFRNYGISKPHIYVLNPFTDNIEFMKYRIKHADVLFGVGGNPITIMKMLDKLNILEDVKLFNGIFIGASASAMVQVKEFMLCNAYGEEYEYGYSTGLGYIENYDILVHRDYNDELQNEAKMRTIHERPNVKILNIEDHKCEIFETHIYKHNKLITKHDTKLLDDYIEQYEEHKETLGDKIKHMWMKWSK